MSTPGKAVLIAGLAGVSPAAAQQSFGVDPAGVLAMLQASLAAAKDAGIDCEPFFADPKDAAASVQAFDTKLRSQRWDGVMIGFGLRGTKEFTPLFEDLVNAVVVAAPGAKFGFSVAPDAVFETSKRMFPEVFA